MKLSRVTYGWIAFIFLSAVFMRQALNLLLTVVERDLLAVMLLAAVGGGTAILLRYVIISRSSVHFARLGAGIALASMLFCALDLVEERVHIPKYGILGAMAFLDLKNRPHSFFWAVAVGTLVGSLDETLQWLLPWRVGDVRDVGINVVSVVAGALVASAFLKGGAK